MEHLELFTPIEQWEPKQGTYTCIAMNTVILLNYCKKNHFEKEFSFYNIGFQKINSVTHVLDLSKLTTKEKAKEKMEECIDTISDYVVEFADSSHEERIKALKEVFDNL